MKKRLASFLLVIVVIVTSAFVVIPASAASSADDYVVPEITIPEKLVVPDNDMLTNEQEYYLAEGSRWQQKVTTDFMAEGFKSRNGTYNHQKYIIIHNTGAYPASSTALANHNYGKTTDAEVSWHYTTGNDGIYQMLPVNEKGWHAGGNYWGSGATAEQKKKNGWIEDCSNSTGVGIETATPGFPADNTSGGEHWNKPEMYEWYETTFDKTATYLAELVATLCIRLNFNPYTQVAQHYSSAAKNCPMQMRYVFGTTNTFTFHGTYFDVMLDRMYDYYKAFGGSYVETDKFQNEYYNPNAVVYKKGLYKANAATTVYRGGNTTTETVGTVAAGDVVDVKIVGFDWGKITLANGAEGWVKLTGLTFVTDEYDYGTYRIAADGAAGDVILGDVNGDEVVDNSDAAQILRYDAKLSTTIDEVAGDVNGDEAVDSGDAALILRYEAQLIPGFDASPVAGEQVVEITKIENGVGTYAGGTVDMTKATRVYKVEVEGDTVFGSEPKYLAAGETFKVSAKPAEGVGHIDIWETVLGVASIEDRSSSETTVTVLNSDVKLKPSYTDNQTLTVEYGTGSGRYQIGTEVKISALARAGYTFTGWKLKSGEGTFADAKAPTTTFKLGSTDTVITAEYEMKVYKDFTGYTNFASGKTYEMTWGGTSFKDLTDGWYRDSAKDTGTKLTDGTIATGGFALADSIYVAFIGTGKVCEVTIDLGAAKKIGYVVLRDTCDNGGSIGDIAQSSASVEVATSKGEFKPVEAFGDDLFFSWKLDDAGSATTVGGTQLKTHVFSFTEVEAQYVKLTFKSGAYVLYFSEVEAWGPTNQG